MSIEECGERVLRGIQRNDRYIFTHRTSNPIFKQIIKAAAEEP
jgi:hypothetical protein